jgi:hypothetical protein
MASAPSATRIGCAVAKCKECNGCGYSDGTPLETGGSPTHKANKCPICSCDDCGFSPCECGVKCQYCKADVYSFGEKESLMCASCFGL